SCSPQYACLSPVCRILSLASPGFDPVATLAAGSILVLRLASLLADQRKFAGVVDRLTHAVEIDVAFVEGEMSRQFGVRLQRTGFEQGPHLLAIPGVEQFRGPLAEGGGEVVDVAQQHRARGV